MNSHESMKYNKSLNNNNKIQVIIKIPNEQQYKLPEQNTTKPNEQRSKQ